MSYNNMQITLRVYSLWFIYSIFDVETKAFYFIFISQSLRYQCGNRYFPAGSEWWVGKGEFSFGATSD